MATLPALRPALTSVTFTKMARDWYSNRARKTTWPSAEAQIQYHLVGEAF